MTGRSPLCLREQTVSLRIFNASFIFSSSFLFQFFPPAFLFIVGFYAAVVVVDDVGYSLPKNFPVFFYDAKKSETCLSSVSVDEFWFTVWVCVCVFHIESDDDLRINDSHLIMFMMMMMVWSRQKRVLYLPFDVNEWDWKAVNEHNWFFFFSLQLDTLRYSVPFTEYPNCILCRQCMHRHCHTPHS